MQLRDSAGISQAKGQSKKENKYVYSFMNPVFPEKAANQKKDGRRKHVECNSKCFGENR